MSIKRVVFNPEAAPKIKRVIFDPHAGRKAKGGGVWASLVDDSPYGCGQRGCEAKMGEGTKVLKRHDGSPLLCEEHGTEWLEQRGNDGEKRRTKRRRTVEANERTT